MKAIRKGWVILSEGGHICEFTFSTTRVGSIDQYTRLWVNDNWKHHYYKGCRCVKATKTITLDVNKDVKCNDCGKNSDDIIPPYGYCKDCWEDKILKFTKS